MSIVKHTPHRRQDGVVLIVALLLLLVLSILASVSIRGASSTEQVANQSRQKTLAQQNAEAALRFCEQQVQAHELVATNGFAPQAPPVGAGVQFSWQHMNNWDALLASAADPTFTLADLKSVVVTSAGDVAGAGGVTAVTYFARPAECMSQYTTPGNTKVFVTTARGFGPEVGAKDGNTPQGTEVWLQSVITMK